MSFQIHPALRAAPGFPLGAAVSFAMVLATMILLIALALNGVGLVEWEL